MYWSNLADVIYTCIHTNYQVCLLRTGGGVHLEIHLSTEPKNPPIYMDPIEFPPSWMDYTSLDRLRPNLNRLHKPSDFLLPMRTMGWSIGAIFLEVESSKEIIRFPHVLVSSGAYIRWTVWWTIWMIFNQMVKRDRSPSPIEEDFRYVHIHGGRSLCTG